MPTLLKLGISTKKRKRKREREREREREKSWRLRNWRRVESAHVEKGHCSCLHMPVSFGIFCMTRDLC